MLELLRSFLFVLLSALAIVLTVEIKRVGLTVPTTAETIKKDFYGFDFLDATYDEAVSHNLDLIRPRPRNLRLIFIGDSVTRYQYLSLAYFLRYGRWFDPDIQLNDLVNSHSFHHPFHPFEDWNEFFLQTNRILYPLETCDCTRDQHVSVERRYFKDTALNNILVYLNINGNETNEGHGHFGRLEGGLVFREFEAGLPFGVGKINFDDIAWEFDRWSGIIRHHISDMQLQPALVVLNAGLHSHDFRDVEKAQQLQQSLRDSGMKSVWKTTTYRKSELRKDAISGATLRKTDERMCRLLDACFNISWTVDLHPDLYFDELHFREPVYRILNEVLLEQAGLLPKGYELLDRSHLLD